MSIVRNPIDRHKLNVEPTTFIPDLAYEISEQDLENINGGTGPVCSSIALSIIGLSYVTNLVTAMNSVEPNSDPMSMPEGIAYPQSK